MLDDKMRGISKAAAMSGNPALAGNVFDELEQALEKLRKEFEAHKSQNAREHDQLREHLAKAATKEELDELEERMVQQLQDLVEQLKGMVPDKDQLKKKLQSLEKNVSHFFVAFEQFCFWDIFLYASYITNNPHSSCVQLKQLWDQLVGI